MRIPKILAQNVNSILLANYGEFHESQSKVIAERVLAYIKNETHLSTKEIKAQLVAGDDSAVVAAMIAVIASGKAPWSQGRLEDKQQKMRFDLVKGNIPELRRVLADTELLKTVLWKKDLKVLGETRELLKVILEDVFHQIEGKELTDQENFHVEAMVGNFLTIFPHLRPEPGEKINVPICVEGKWKLIPYKSEEIQLTPSWMGSPIVAFGLSSSDGPPLLVYKATTYPTDKGASLSILTNINPGASVGAYVFKIGQKKLASWLEAQTTASEQKAIVFGKSLGGAHAWRSALEFPSFVSKSMCFVAPGFYPADLAKLKKLYKNNTLPEINIFFQHKDSIQHEHFDLIAKKGVNYYEVIGEKRRKGLAQHLQLDAMHEQSVILHKKPAARSLRRAGITGIRVLSSLTLFPLLTVPHSLRAIIRQIKH